MKLKLSSCSCARVWKHKETPQDTRRAILVATDKVLNVMQRPKSLWRWSVNPWPVGTMWIFTSLVPRPSHHPVFWSLAVCKNGGGRPGLFYHMNDISVYLSRQRGEGVTHRKNELEAWSCCFCLKCWRCEAKSVLLLVQNEERVRKMRTHARMHARTHAHMHALTQACRHTGTRAFTHACTQTHTYSFTQLVIVCRSDKKNARYILYDI